MKEVGAVLSLTARTVAFHKYRIMEVLNTRTNAELVQFAIRNNVVARHDSLSVTRMAASAAAAATSEAISN